MAGTLTAGNVLVFEDYVVGTSAIPGALTLWGGCGTCTTTTDTGTFNTLGEYSASAAELTAYINAGGRLIGQTWLTGGLDGLLQASHVSSNGNVITTDGNAVFAGLGSTISLSNPGWGIYSQGWSPVGGAVGIGTFSSGGSAIILGNGGRTYLNAGLTDTYSPTSDGSRLIANEIGLVLNETSVPEPSTFVGLGLGLAVLALRRLRG